MSNAIISQTEQFVTHLLREKLAPDHRFHNLSHTLAVRSVALELAERQQLSAEAQEIIELAALLHDVGYILDYRTHEAASRQIAEEFLKKINYPPKRLAQVISCIDATHPDAHPQDLLQQIIRDADYFNLANEDYLQSIKALRHEWAVFLQKTYTDDEWYRLNYEFIKQHQYFTPAARAMFDMQKEINRKILKQIVKKKSSQTDATPIGDSRSAQMMFKTALRNHIDLSNLADNKANIMLSVSAIIITVAIPLLASYVKNAPFLLYPMIILIVTCLASMLFATLATRPIRMSGRTNSETIQRGESNLFFFGNFYKMNFSEYQTGMRQVLTNEPDLESAIMRDLFFLGKSLGRKYHLLRICYGIFMLGVALTVLVFAISYSWSH